MDATSNFDLRFAEASESKAGMPERLLKRQALKRTVTGLSLISQALGFSIFGMLSIANRHQADLGDFAGGSFVATAAGAGAISAPGVQLGWRLATRLPA